jgi:hypothetical protein
MEFLSVNVIPRYFNFVTFQKELLSVFLYDFAIHALVSFMKLIIKIYEDKRICLNKNLYLQYFNDDAYHKNIKINYS